jgi:hypothetical protein
MAKTAVTKLTVVGSAHAGSTIQEDFNIAKSDCWFLAHIKEIVGFEEELATAKN